MLCRLHLNVSLIKRYLPDASTLLAGGFSLREGKIRRIIEGRVIPKRVAVDVHAGMMAQG